MDRPTSRTWRQQPSIRESPPSDQRRIQPLKTKPMPIIGYDAQAIIDYYDKRPLEVGWRLNCLGLPLLSWYFSLLVDKWLGREKDLTTQRERGKELREHLVRSGSVAFIKSGQALSLRPDLIKNKIWAEELGKLVDAVGSFSDVDAMNILRRELSDLRPESRTTNNKQRDGKALNKLQSLQDTDPILSLFEFANGGRSVASASIGQVYKARIRRGTALEEAIGQAEAEKWGGKTVAIKIQRKDVEASASLDMYLLRRAAMWFSMFRGGGLPAIADQFGMQLFGELDYVREANNCERFRELYGHWSDVLVPQACNPLTRKMVLVMEWVDGKKGPWEDGKGLEMVQIGLKCSVNQLMSTGLFHADPHRGNLLMARSSMRSNDNRLAFIDFGMMADVSEEERYGLVGLIIGLQNKDLPLITENLLMLGFLDDTTQLDLLVPRLREALLKSTGGTGKASDVNFAALQGELDEISRENVLKFKTPPFFTIIIRSLTILEGMALSVDPNFRLVRGSYPYVLRQLLSPPDSTGRTPAALQSLLVRLLTVNGEAREIEWARLRDLLRLASKASKTYDPKEADEGDEVALSRQTIELFFRFLTSRTGIFLKKPLVHELAEAIDNMASIGEANLIRLTSLPALPGMNGPVNERRMEELRQVLDTFQSALQQNQDNNGTSNTARLSGMMDIIQEILEFLNDDRIRQDAGPILAEIQSVVQLVAVEVLEIRGYRAMRSVLQLA
eukprot:CAMPEP_0178897086 /NCGR_PEP_ID=MMETSP0786-20121207/1546_1 /TAXON_ID=186022 /ORGANISM="Thalassionema frauenfeldii, Strain CCMP 1798" /LENGTH=730 /DNA_ID=CAMNT_0020567587 /DNA_START=193 /DNA_END=2385 /DNA_ORIENTATION=-